MQTVPIEDLQNSPLETLWNIHIQPPMLDAIRAILVHLWPAQNLYSAIQHVDMLLYFLWALTYGLIGSLTYVWVRAMTDSRIALISSSIVLLHPASILYATLLDTTLLSTLLILWTYYLLWKIKNNQQVSLLLLIIASAGLFFTRSIFQWPFFVLFVITLFLIGLPIKRLALFSVIAGLLIGGYVAKQYIQFGTTSTSSFTGLNLVRSVGLYDVIPYPEYLRSLTATQDAVLPDVLTRQTKVNGSPNYNNIHYLAYNRMLMSDYKQYIMTLPLAALSRSYTENLWIYLKPSSAYTSNVIVDPLPWRDLFDGIFSYPVLPTLLLISTTIWLMNKNKSKSPAASLGFILPGLFVFWASILFEKGENDRFKYFLEPVFLIFIVTQFRAAVGRFLPNRAER